MRLEDKQVDHKQVGDNRQVGNLEDKEVAVVGNHTPLRTAVEVDIQLQEELADQGETLLEPVVLPLVVDQTYHLFCPFQLCVVSACMRKPCNTPDQPNISLTQQPERVLHFQQCMQLRNIYRQVVGDIT